MKWLTWTLQILLALAFAGAGMTRLTTPKAELEQTMAWATDFSDGQVQAIGAAEVTGAIGLIVPAATGIVPVLTPVAAGALAVIMGGAAVTHLQRGEPPYAPLVLGVLCVVVAWLRWPRQG
jgi:hypothetical protein